MPNSRATVEVVVIGAGAAGLAAARALDDANVPYVVLEARDRIGGRILTVHDPDTNIAIELGAEFVHGSAPELEDLLRRAGLRSLEVDGPRWLASGGRLRRMDDFWDRLDGVLGRLRPRREDESFQRFLDRRPGGARLAADRRLTRQYVEGFHAADPRLVSARALAEDGSPGEDVRERRIGRVVGGYGGAIQWLAAPLSRCLRLDTIVTRVEWRRGSVRVQSRAADGRARPPIEARAAIVSLPLGVLKAPPGATGSVAFDPPLRPKERALQTLAMGPVVRLALRFRDRFWASEWFARAAGRDDLDTLSFLQSMDADFPVWWTASPLRAPVMVAWSGGPSAARLARLAPDEIERRAVASLASHLPLSSQRVRGLLTGVWMHDWQHDPFTRGAYSYQMVGGSDAPSVLARPLRSTLFFAGEAADPEGRTGTVHGAIATGRRAASQVIRALGRAARG